MGKNTAIAGGLLTGVGKFMVDDAEAKRQAAIDRVRMEYQREEKQEDRAFNSGLLSKTVQDEQGNIHGVTRGGKAIDLGIKGPKPKGSGKSGPGYMSPEDKRVWDAAVLRHTTDSMQGKQTDWEGVSSTLADQGREDLASMAGPVGDSGKIKVDSPEYREAQRQADAWIEDQAGYRTTDETDFADHGGSREQARQAKTLEIYGQLTGKGERVAKGSTDGGRSGGKQQAGNASKQAKGKSGYTSADEVKAAMNSGKISREQALSILRSDFGFK